MRPQLCSVMPRPSLHATIARTFCQNQLEESANLPKAVPSKLRSDDPFDSKRFYFLINFTIQLNRFTNQWNSFNNFILIIVIHHNSLQNSILPINWDTFLIFWLPILSIYILHTLDILDISFTLKIFLLYSNLSSASLQSNLLEL